MAHGHRRSVADDEGHRHSLRSASLLLSLGCVLGCQDAAPVVQLAATDGEVLGKWEDAFVGGELELEIPGRNLLTIGQVVIGSDGDLYIPAGSGTEPTILRFSPDGHLVSEIPVHESGAFSAFAVSPDDSTLFVFDPLDRKVIVLKNPSGDVLRHFQLPTWPSAIVPLPDGTLVTYSTVGDRSGRVFERYSHGGRRLAASHRVDDDALRIFHGRVRTGGVVQVSDGGLIGVHPNAFEFVRLSPDLEVVEVLRPPQKINTWAKQPPSFPAGLDPYEYRPTHEQWWDSFLHIGHPFALTSDLLLVTVWMSRGMAEAQNFANVYTSDGTVVAEGLRVPHDGRIVGAGRGRVFVVRNAAISDTGSTERLEFYAYVFRQEADGWRDRDHSVSR